MDGCVDLAGILRLQSLDQRVRRRPRRAVGPQFVPEPRREQAALSLVEGVGIGLEGLDLLHQSGDVAGKAVVLDRGRGLAEMIAVLDELGEGRGLVGAVMERRGRRVERRQRRRVEQRLHASVALGDIDDVAMDVVDRPPDKLSEVGSQRQRARCRSIRILDRCDLFIELVDDDVGVQIGEVVDLGVRRAQHLLHADEVGHDQVDLIRADATDLAGRCIVE